MEESVPLSSKMLSQPRSRLGGWAVAPLELLVTLPSDMELPKAAKMGHLSCANGAQTRRAVQSGARATCARWLSEYRLLC